MSLTEHRWLLTDAFAIVQFNAYVTNERKIVWNWGTCLVNFDLNRTKRNNKNENYNGNYKFCELISTWSLIMSQNIYKMKLTQKRTINYFILVCTSLCFVLIYHFSLSSTVLLSMHNTSIIKWKCIKERKNKVCYHWCLTNKQRIQKEILNKEISTRMKMLFNWGKR